MTILKPNKFIFIGDSLTFGYGVKKDKCFVELFKKYSLASNLNFYIINKGFEEKVTIIKSQIK